jgi:hypothetical protein
MGGVDERSITLKRREEVYEFRDKSEGFEDSGDRLEPCETCEPGEGYGDFGFMVEVAAIDVRKIEPASTDLP